jgi:hypothetical protein
MFVFIFLADLNFIMAYIISLFVIIIVYQNPLVYRIVNEFLNNNVFDTVSLSHINLGESNLRGVANL